MTITIPRQHVSTGMSGARRRGPVGGPRPRVAESLRLSGTEPVPPFRTVECSNLAVAAGVGRAAGCRAAAPSARTQRRSPRREALGATFAGCVFGLGVVLGGWALADDSQVGPDGPASPPPAPAAASAPR